MGRSQTLWWLEEEGVKATENKNIGPLGYVDVSFLVFVGRFCVLNPICPNALPDGIVDIASQGPNYL
jgi:hypothetical protein